MLKKTVLTIVLLTACLWCLVLVASAGSGPPETAQPGGAPSSPPTPSAAGSYALVAPVEALMHLQDYCFGRVRDLVVDEQAEDRFEEMEAQAFGLAELCNLNAYRAEHDDYRNWAMTARDASLKIAAAAKQKDVEQVKSLSRDIQKTCKACHDKYD